MASHSLAGRKAWAFGAAEAKTMKPNFFHEVLKPKSVFVAELHCIQLSKNDLRSPIHNYGAGKDGNFLHAASLAYSKCLVFAEFRASQVYGRFQQLVRVHRAGTPSSGKRPVHFGRLLSCLRARPSSGSKPPKQGRLVFLIG